MQVQDLIEALGQFDPDAEVRLAVQPGWPFEHSISQVEALEPDECTECGHRIGGHFEDCSEPEIESVVYIAEGGQLDYLPGAAREILGW